MAQGVSDKSNIVGQYRFAGASSCRTDISSKSRAEYWYANMNSEAVETTSASFRDLDIKVDVNDAFDRETDYYLWIKIPQDLNYDYSIDVKLMKRDEDDETKIYYQNLKQISILKGGSGQGVYTVVLYEDPTDSNEIKADIAIAPNNVSTGPFENGVLYKTEQDHVMHYWKGKGGTSKVEVTNFNDIEMAASWRHDTGEYFGIFEFVFRPIEEDFCDIVFQMVRDASDYNIQTQDDNTGEIVYGRYIDKDKVEYKLYKLTNLVGSIAGNDDIPLDQIGVWSHPGLPMSINGEEVYVPMRGYYELDTIPIESIAMVADGVEDFFTIDYRYTQEGGE